MSDDDECASEPPGPVPGGGRGYCTDALMPHRGSVVMIVDSIGDETAMYAEALLADGFRVTPCEEPARALAEAMQIHRTLW